MRDAVGPRPATTTHNASTAQTENNYNEETLLQEAANGHDTDEKNVCFVAIKNYAVDPQVWHRCGRSRCAMQGPHRRVKGIRELPDPNMEVPSNGSASSARSLLARCCWVSMRKKREEKRKKAEREAPFCCSPALALVSVDHVSTSSSHLCLRCSSRSLLRLF